MPPQFISPHQWESLKATISVLNEAEADGHTDLADWFFELRDQLTQLVIATSEPIQPFRLSEHFAYLLDMYVAGAQMQDKLAEGSQAVVDWAQQTLRSCAALGIRPVANSDKSIYLVVHAMEGIEE